jgi:hypothetical protein
MGCPLALCHPITIFQVVVPPQMRKNLLDRPLIHLPCLSFFPHLCKEKECVSTVKQSNPAIITGGLFAPPPLLAAIFAMMH